MEFSKSVLEIPLCGHSIQTDQSIATALERMIEQTIGRKIERMIDLPIAESQEKSTPQSSGQPLAQIFGQATAALSVIAAVDTLSLINQVVANESSFAATAL